MSTNSIAATQAVNFGRTANRAFSDHPVPSAPVKHKAVQEAVTAYAYANARAAYNEARRQSGTTEDEWTAQEADKQARADALEKGKDDPRTPRHDRWKAERADHLRLIEARAEVASRRERELRAALDEHRAAVAATHRAEAAKGHEKIMGLLDQVAQECNAIALSIRLAEWADAFPGWDGRDRTWGRSLIVDRKMGGEAITSDDFVATLRKALSEAVHPPEPPAVRVLGRKAA